MLCILGTLSALALQTVLFQYTSSKFVYEKAWEASRNSLGNMQDEIYTFTKSIENSLSRIYGYPEVTGGLASGESIDFMRLRHNRLALDMAMNDFQRAQNVNALYIYTNSGELLSLYRHASTPRYTYPEDIFDDPSENNAQIVLDYIRSDRKTMLVSSYFNTRREQEIVRFVLKIFTDNGSRVTGFIVCDVDSRAIRSLMEKYNYSDEQVVWLQPAGDRPIIRIGLLSPAQRSDYERVAGAIQEGEWASEGNVAGQSVFFEIPQKEFDLTAFSLAPQFLLEESQRALTRNLIIIAAAIILIFSLLSVFISNVFAKPLLGMVSIMDRIKNGEAELRVGVERDDELGRLGDSFNNMLDRIESLIASEYQAKLHTAQAELKAIQAQVNPHFLYNTLDTMSGIASSQQCESVSRMCRALSGMFRYSLDMKDPLSTVESEITHIKNYMFVMDTRMGNSVTLTFDIDGSIMREFVPRISLQPLVENAILHGLKNKHGEKRLAIAGAVSGPNLVISVEDNGVGMDTDAINARLRSDGQSVLEKGSSIGLSNIHARTRLLFGGEYGVTVTSRAGRGSRVELLIPRSAAVADDD